MKTIPAVKLVSWIIRDAARALAKFTALSPRDVRRAQSSIKRYQKKLLWMAQKGEAVIGKAALYSFDAHFCAALRAAERADAPHVTFPDLNNLARQAYHGHASSEPVKARWEPKDKGFRLIVELGTVRTTRCLVFRDALTCLGYDSPYDYSRRSQGGEKAFVASVIERICAGQSWVATADIKKCFASMRPGHLEWLPLTTDQLRKEVFISEEAKVEVSLSGNAARLWVFLQSEYSAAISTSIQSSITDVTTRMVRQALPEGNLLSPLLARSFIGREIQASLGSLGDAISTFLDDLAFCAGAQSIATAAMQALEVRLKSHPAGPIELHSKQLRDAKAWKTAGRVQVLKYLLEPGRGYNCPVHVKPGPGRFGRFRKRLKQRLDAAKALGQDVDEKGFIYSKRWYRSQQAWTKVPGHSKQVFEVAALCTIHEYAPIPK